MNSMHICFLLEIYHACKVGVAAKQHAEDAAAELDGTYLRVQSVATCNNEDISYRCRMYKNYGSAQAVIIKYADAVSHYIAVR
jgi:hypothetical protein